MQGPCPSHSQLYSELGDGTRQSRGAAVGPLKLVVQPLALGLAVAKGRFHGLPVPAGPIVDAGLPDAG
jgi:hypothetical protein